MSEQPNPTPAADDKKVDGNEHINLKVVGNVSFIFYS